MQRLWNLNWENITYDHDISGLVRGLTDWGVIEGGTVVGNKLQPVQAIVLLVRSNGQKILAFFESDEVINLPTSGDYKVYIEVDQSKIDFGGNNAEDGTGIASIKTWPTLPSQNFLLLASVTSWVTKDERNLIPKVGQIAQRTTTLESKVATQEEKVGKLEEAGTPDHLETKIFPNSPISREYYEAIFRNINKDSKNYGLQTINYLKQHVKISDLHRLSTITDKVYVSVLFFRKAEGETTISYEIGTHKWTQKVKLNTIYDEVVIEVPLSAIESETFLVNIKFDTNYLGYFLLGAIAQNLYYVAWSQSYLDRAVPITLFIKKNLDFNLIGKTNRQGRGVSARECLGISLDTHEWYGDLLLPSDSKKNGDSIEFRKGNFVGRSFEIKKPTKLKTISVDGVFSDTTGNANISIYKEDSLWWIDTAQRVFTTSVAKSKFAIWLFEGQKSYRNNDIIFEQTIPFDWLISISTQALSWGYLYIYVDDKQISWVTTSSTYFTRIRAGQKLKILAITNPTVTNLLVAVSPKNSTQYTIPIDTTLDKGRYQVVIDWGLTIKNWRSGNLIMPWRYKITHSSDLFVVYANEDPILAGDSSVAGREFSIEKASSISTQGSPWNSGANLTFYPNELFISSGSLTNLQRDRGIPFIWIEFEKTNSIKVILNHGVATFLHQKFIPGEIYYIHKMSLYTAEELSSLWVTQNLQKFWIAVSVNQIYLDIAPTIDTTVTTGSIPLGNAVGFMEMGGHKVPVYG